MGDVAQQRTSETEFRLWQHGLIFIAACLVIISRRPETLFHAQFYAEDGHTWFADAYNLGWGTALLRTWAGYFQTLPRLGAALALLLPFSRVPLFLNLLALPLQVLPVNLVLSSRMANWGSLQFRAFLAASYLALPNCMEVNRGLTEANFLVAFSALLVVLAGVPKTRGGQIFDVFILLLCGLSCPFGLFLLPVVAFLAWQERESWRRVQAAVLGICTSVQLWAMFFLAPAARTHRDLGASPGLFGRLLGSQVYIGALLGRNGFSARQGEGFTLLLAIIAIAGTALVLCCALRSPIQMKLFIAFSALMFAAELSNPVEWEHPKVPVWLVYAGVPGMRYWFFPTLAFVWALLYGCKSGARPVKAISALLLVIMPYGIIRDWRHLSMNETNFAASVKTFERAPIGTTVTIPEQPEGWSMQLIKH